jgi:glucose/arabinose dehydrogenase/PKD repeat protein
LTRATRIAALAAVLLIGAGAPWPASRAAQAAPNPTPPSGFAVETVLGGHGELANPNAVAFAADGSVFVAQKNGIIKRFDGLDDPTPQTFADLRTEVYDYIDKGLLGLAVDPAFSTGRPYVYASYSYDAPPGEVAPYWNDTCPNPPGATTGGCVTTAKIVRFTVTGTDPAGTPLTLLQGEWCHQFWTHTIGHIEIGPDGALYASAGEGSNANLVDYGQLGVPSPNPCGDPGGATPTPPTAEGGALRAQDARTSADPQDLGGTIVRIDPDTGLGMPGNPFAASADENRQRITAYGLRNPYRFTFRPGTNEMWIPDVGWNHVEEVNRATDVTDATVDNFGWPCYEGAARQGAFDAADLTICEDLYTDGTARAPFVEYSHDAAVVPGETCDRTNGSAATAAAFYDGGDYPDEFDGALVFGDFARQCLWVVYPGGDGLPDWDSRQVFLTHGRYVTDLEVGPGGDLYWVDGGAGRVERIRYYAGNRPPAAQITASATSGTVPLDVTFSGLSSTDPDAGDSITAYAWDLDGDGDYDDSTGPTPEVQFVDAGVVLVSLRVTDESGATDTDTIAVTPAETPPVALFTIPDTHVEGDELVSDDLFSVGQTISFTGVALDNQDGLVPASSYRFELRQQHCVAQGGCHTHLVQTFEGVSSGSFAAPDHGYPSYLELELFATDSVGLTGSQVLRIDPRTGTLEITSDPAGLDVVIDSETVTTPVTQTVIADSQHSLSADSPQELAGRIWTFDAWSDAGAADHTITVPEAGTELTVTWNDAGPAPSAYTYWITGVDGRTEQFARNAHTTWAEPISVAFDIVAAARTETGNGLWRVSRAGRVAGRGDARSFGGLTAGQRTAAVVDIEGTETGRGYWILLADGSLHAFGDAIDRGNPTSRQVKGAAVAMVRTPSGNGYWITDARGALYPYGDARWRGSLAGTFHAPVVDIEATASGYGYWMLTDTGAVYAFGNAVNLGSHLSGQRAVAIEATPSGAGYWLLGAKGSIWAYGDAPWYGRWDRVRAPVDLG